MMRFKKGIAIVLAATMVMGMSITAFADDPVTSGGTDGSGASEGHVEKELINVILPTVPDGSTPFAYTMDPERLIQATDAAKYAEGTTFPEAEGDTGVYFLTAENTYANSSSVLQAINKSSCAIKLTVKVKTTQNTAKDIALATSSTPAATGTTPELYLGLKVGNAETAATVVSATEATVDKVVPGVESNFEVAVAEGAYVYREKASATDWKAVNLQMEGAVSNLAVASDTTAPTVNVTWEYAKAASDATASTDVVDYTSTPACPVTGTGMTVVSDQAYNLTATFTKGTAYDINFTGVTGATWATTVDGSYTTSSNISVGTNKVTIAAGNWGGASVGDYRFVKVTDGTNTYIIRFTIVAP